MDSFFVRQLTAYATYHRDARNRVTHFIGIPAIVFAILLPLALYRYDGLSAALVVASIAVTGWIRLDVMIGAAMLVVIAPMWIAAEWIARQHSATAAWIMFAIFFVGGWAFQLIGHMFEGRRPALADNLFQAFIGPMFLMAEVLIALGFKRDLKAAIERAGHAS